MIGRMWRARTSGPENTARYQGVFEREVLADLRGLAGFRGAYLLARDDREITTLTLFDSLETVGLFAGPDPSREHVTGAARAVLEASDPIVRHYSVLTAVLADR